jgi:hypothetical protein
MYIDQGLTLFEMIKSSMPYMLLAYFAVQFMRFWGAVAVAGASLLGSYMSSENQSDAAQSAAGAQQASSQYATDAQLMMWNQAREDFGPYLNAGYTGLTSLQHQLPNYMQNTLIPAAQQLANWRPQSLPSPNFAINPVTGQMQGSNAFAPAINMQQSQPNQWQAPRQQPVTFEAPQNITPVDQRRILGTGTFEDTPQSVFDMMEALNEAGVHLGIDSRDPTQATSMTWTNQANAPNNQEHMALYRYMQNPDQPPPPELTSYFNRIGVDMPDLSGQKPYQIAQNQTANTIGAANNLLSSPDSLHRVSKEYSIPDKIAQNQTLSSPDSLHRVSKEYSIPDNLVPHYNQGTQNAFSAGATPEQISQGGPFSPAVPNFMREMDTSQYNVSVPDFARSLNPEDPRFSVQNANQYALESTNIQRPLDFQFNPNDPSYQTKAKMKEEEINTFLAKQGLMGSTAGQSYFQREMDKFRADEEANQYNRALTERNYLTQSDIDQYRLDADRSNTMYGRDYQTAQDLYGRELTERDYGTQADVNRYNMQRQNAMDRYGRDVGERNYRTQADIDRYNLMEQRGDTLWGRTYGQQQDLYNRQLQNTLLNNQMTQGALGQQYDVARDLYGTMYGNALNLANMGQGATGQLGNLGAQTGQGIASNYLAAGNAAAQGALAQGQANAGLWNTIGNAPMNYLAAQNYMNPQTNYMQPNVPTGANAAAGYGTSTYDLDYGYY